MIKAIGWLVVAYIVGQLGLIIGEKIFNDKK